MPNDNTPTSDHDQRNEVEEIREDLEALRSRVRRIESRRTQDDTSPGDHIGNGLDRRDRVVLAHVRKTGASPGPRETLRLYKQLTDIVQDSTAKERAKNLRGTEAFEKAVSKNE